MDIKRVRIKYWEELKESCYKITDGGDLEFEDDKGNLLFLDEMGEFCGEEFVVEVDECGNFRYAGYTFVPDMYEVIENNLTFNKLPKMTLKIQHHNHNKESSVEYCMKVNLEEVLDIVSKRDSFHQTMEIFGIPAKMFVEFSCE